MDMHKSSDRLNWDDLKFFTALANTSRISAAATRLGVNYVTVSRRIDRLEETLKKKLFTRTNEGYFLTLEGEELQKSLTVVTGALEDIADTATISANTKRTVKISMVHSIAEWLLIPSLAKLQKTYPNLSIEVDVSTRNVSIVKRESDIALRLALPESGDYISRRLANLDYVLCGNEHLVNMHKNGQDVPTVNYDQDLSKLPESQYLLKHFGVDNIAFQSNSATVQRQAALHGIGLAVLPYFLFKDSGLHAIKMEERLQREVWLLARKNTSQITGVRLVIDNIVKLFKESDLLEYKA